MKCIENIKTRKCITKKDGHERNCKEMKGYGRNVGQCIQIYEISDKTEQHNSCATNRNNTKNRSHSKLLCLITGPQRFFLFQNYVKPTQGNLGHYCSIATIYDIFMIEKNWLLHGSNILFKMCSGTWVFAKKYWI